MNAPPVVRRSSNQGIDASLREYLQTNADIVTRITKAVRIDDIGALSAQSDQPILFENIVEKPGFRLTDILVKNRRSQARAIGVEPKDYLKTLAYRLRQPPRGFKNVKSGPVKEVIKIGADADWTQLPIPFHKDKDDAPYVTAMNIIKDPETGFYNSCHAGTHAVGPRRGLVSFVTPHSHAIMKKYRDMGAEYMPIAFVIGVPPAYEIMANFSGLHMDSWGEMEMVGTIMDRDVEMVPCETLDLTVPAEAEIIVEGRIKLNGRTRVGEVTSPSMYHLPHYEDLPEVEITAITMRGDRPIYRNHQTTPATDHQPLPRLCHEAVLYNRLTEMGVDVKDVRFPTWGAALSCILQVDSPARRLHERRADDGDGRALAQHQDRGCGQSGHRCGRSRRCLSRDRHALRSIARRHHRQQYARFALRPIGQADSKAITRGASLARWESMRRRSHATIPRILNEPGPATGAR